MVGKNLSNSIIKNLTDAKIGEEYKIVAIKTNDSDLENFLFTLGCYEGEKITVVALLSDNYTVAIKDARYSIDSQLAEAIII